MVLKQEAGKKEVRKKKKARRGITVAGSLIKKVMASLLSHS